MSCTAHLSCIVQAFKTGADELPPIAQARENMCSSRNSYNSSRGQMPQSSSVAPIAHPAQICAEELSFIAQALKACADELPPIVQAFKTCAAHVAHVAHPGQNVCR